MKQYVRWQSVNIVMVVILVSIIVLGSGAVPGLMLHRTLAQAAVEFCAARSASSSVFSAGEIALPAVHGQRVAQLYMYDICM